MIEATTIHQMLILYAFQTMVMIMMMTMRGVMTRSILNVITRIVRSLIILQILDRVKMKQVWQLMIQTFVLQLIIQLRMLMK